MAREIMYNNFEIYKSWYYLYKFHLEFEFFFTDFFGENILKNGLRGYFRFWTKILFKPCLGWDEQGGRLYPPFL